MTTHPARPLALRPTLLAALAALPLSAAALAQEITRLAPPPNPAESIPPVALPGLKYDAPFFPNATYNKDVPTPDSVLGFPVGSRPVTAGQVEAVLKAIAAKSPRVKLVEYARSHEGRPLHFAIIATPERLKDLDALKADYALLHDPRKAPAADVDRLIDKLPALAWMAYVIHGDELSGTDAALAALHHLAAGEDDEVKKLLDQVVVVIDPLMNPDGRDRFLNTMRQHRPKQPQVDDQSLMHEGLWSRGRMNHYLFDMNRDWIFGTQPETRGRLASIKAWNPHYFMESHEMGSQDTFLFLPAREAINHNHAPSVLKWVATFGRDQAAAFDAKGWRYYTGEWNDDWYPGYSSSWAGLRGSVQNLYEQAAIAVDAVRRPEGALEAYRESVHKQLVSTMANLATLAKNRKAILADFVAERRAVLADNSPYASRAFAIKPSTNTTRFNAFLDLLTLQGIEFIRAEQPFTASGLDRLGREAKDIQFPEGTIFIPNRQPLARLLAAMLEFDPRMKPEYLTLERRELLRFGRSKIYDITGWSLPMLFDLEAYQLAGSLPAVTGSGPLAGPAVPDKAVAAPVIPNADSPVGFVISGADDRSVAAAARLMERGVWVRVSNKPTALADATIPRGSIFLLKKDNAHTGIDLLKSLQDVLKELSLTASGLQSGWGEGDLPDLGGEHFVLAQPPRIAVLGRDPSNPYSFGQAWYTLDYVLGVRASYLDFDAAAFADLRRYNVLILPEGTSARLADRLPALKAWTEAGGTLIAMGDAAAALTGEHGLVAARTLQDALTKPEPFIQAVIREYHGLTETIAPPTGYDFTPPPPTGDHALAFPWDGTTDDKPSDDELKRRDEWRSLFMPQGVVLAARLDDRSFITAGASEPDGYVPVLYTGGTVLLAHAGNAPARLGVFSPAPTTTEPAAAPATTPQPTDHHDTSSPQKPKPGWTIAPPGHELRLRMSGLLWPEAAERLANSAYVVREQVGAGQVILFASDPNFRAATHGTARLFMNAAVLGPGLGTSQPIKP
jgi:hypothetical protein